MVPVRQPLGRLIVVLLEPRSDDGFLAWNLFDPAIASGFDTNDFNGSIGDPTFTSNIRFAIERNDWTFNWYVDFINGMDNSIFDNETFNYFGFPDARRVIQTPSVRYHDFSARWEGPATNTAAGSAPSSRTR